MRKAACYASRMAHTCSICSKGEQVATTVNEMLWTKKTLAEISTQTNFHPSSIHRHKFGDCVFSFPKFKAAKVAAKNKPMGQGGRLVVCWPVGSVFHGAPPSTTERFTLMDGHGGEIKRAELRVSDTLLTVRYQRPLLSEELVSEAFAENLERSLAQTLQ